ncbi:MAG: hypothetical protein V1906_00020 [Candidatus Woesearchaeota archaeon]
MSTLRKLIASAGLAIGLLGSEASVEAKPVSVTLGSDITLTRGEKMEIISQRHFGKSYGKISRERRIGVSWAADKATVKLDPKCNASMLIWDDDHIRWGADWQRRQDGRKASVTATESSGRDDGKGPSATYGGRPTSVYNDNSINNSFNVQVTVYKTDDGRLYMIEKRLDDNGKVVEQSRRRISILENKVKEAEKELTSLKQESEPYSPKSEVSANGGFYDERRGGNSFSRGYFGGADALLRKNFGSGRIGQLELKAEGLHTAYTQDGGDATVFNGKVRGMLGKRTTAGSVAYEVSGGVSANVSAGQDSYGGFKVGFTEGTALAELEARLDSRYVSAVGKAAVGGGAQTVRGEGVNLTSPLLRAEGSVGLEGHAGPVEITGEAGVRYDRLNVQGVARDNTTAYGRGCVGATLGRGVGVGACVEGGQHTGDQGKSTYVQGTGRLRVRF